MKQPHKALGDLLARCRLGAGLTQRQVSDHLEYSSAQFISNFECGRVIPPAAKLGRMIKLYNVPKQLVVDAVVAAYRKELEAEIR